MNLFADNTKENKFSSNDNDIYTKKKKSDDKRFHVSNSEDKQNKINKKHFFKKNTEATSDTKSSTIAIDDFEYDKDLPEWRRILFILKTLVSKDFKLKYRRSVLGVLWSVLNPLLMMIVLTAVFSFIFRFDIENYPLYLILGQILFALMSGATGGAMTSIIEASPLLKKIKVEKTVFPIEKVLFELVNFAISLIAVAVVMIWFGVVPTKALLLLPWLLLMMVVFSLGIGLLLSALAVFFRDVIHLWGVVITAWTYATPIFYPMSMLESWMQQVMNFNPMYHYITYFRDIAMYGTVPELTENLICLLWAVGAIVIGLFAFKKLERKFILYI